MFYLPFVITKIQEYKFEKNLYITLVKVWRFVQNFKLKKCPIKKTSKYMRWIKVIIVLPFQFCQHLQKRSNNVPFGWLEYVHQSGTKCLKLHKSKCRGFLSLEWISSWCSSILHAGHTYTIITYLYN